MNENVVLGPISVVGLRAIPSDCAYPVGTTGKGIDQLTCYQPIDTTNIEFNHLNIHQAGGITSPLELDSNGGGHLLPVSNNNGRLQSYDTLNKLKKNQFLDDSTRLVITLINVYNPHLQLFAAVL
jgi:hypothetical protein